MKKRPIKKVAVIGSGIMGSGIACHFANIGVEVLLLDIVPRELTEVEKAKGLTLENKTVRNRIVNDSLKYISAAFYLNEDYIDRSSFKDIKNEVFSSMYEIVPKSEFILKGKFIYDGQSTKKSTWRTYDWRKIDK